jgi:hypothetical protein
MSGQKSQSGRKRDCTPYQCRTWVRLAGEMTSAVWIPCLYRLNAVVTPSSRYVTDVQKMLGRHF